MIRTSSERAFDNSNSDENTRMPWNMLVVCWEMQSGSDSLSHPALGEIRPTNTLNPFSNTAGKPAGDGHEKYGIPDQPAPSKLPPGRIEAASQSVAGERRYRRDVTAPVRVGRLGG